MQCTDVTEEKVRSLAIDIKRYNGSERLIKSRKIQKLSARSRRRMKSQHWNQANDEHDVAEANKTETHTAPTKEISDHSTGLQDRDEYWRRWSRRLSKSTLEARV